MDDYCNSIFHIPSCSHSYFIHMTIKNILIAIAIVALLIFCSGVVLAFDLLARGVMLMFIIIIVMAIMLKIKKNP